MSKKSDIKLIRFPENKSVSSFTIRKRKDGSNFFDLSSNTDETESLLALEHEHHRKTSSEEQKFLEDFKLLMEFIDLLRSDGSNPNPLPLKKILKKRHRRTKKQMEQRDLGQTCDKKRTHTYKNLGDEFIVI